MAVSYEKELGELDKSITSLRIEYDRFFAGDVRRPPIEKRQRVEKELRRLANQEIEKAAERFRLSTTQSRYNSLVELWEKRLQAREEGRGVFARPRREEAIPLPPPPREAEGGGAAAAGASGGARAVRPGAPGEGAPGGAAAASGPPSDERQSGPVEGRRKVDFSPLFNRYVAARAAVGEDTTKLRYERFEELVRKQAEEIKRKTGTSRLVFEVQTVEGKVRLVGRPAPPKGTK